ncbi:MAG: rRNA pseudouridine synthase [Treponema sp.]|jgi:23S rRNA pseudouridine2605 synthase|nr:rRNA pseudouridine synthase [Treponema sp.]
MPQDTNDVPGVSGDTDERLQRYLARCGVASRRSSEAIILALRVTVNGKTVTVLGTKVAAGDTVCLDGKEIRPEETKRYVALNKPAGHVCSLSDEKGRPVAAELLAKRYTERLYNVGRLDMYSSGLIIFTNDGNFAAKVAHPSSQIEKEYIVETSLPFSPRLPEQFAKGVRVEGVFYRAETVERLSSRRLRIVLMEGKNREIRRVFEHFNAPIKQLCRVRIGSILLKDLPEGESRDLTRAEVEGLLGGED